MSILAYTYSFGDGTSTTLRTDQTANPDKPRHRYSKVGTYTVTVILREWREGYGYGVELGRATTIVRAGIAPLNLTPGAGQAKYAVGKPAAFR